MFPRIIPALMLLSALIRFPSAEAFPASLPQADSLIAKSIRVRDKLSYHGVSEREWKHGEKTSRLKRSVWRQASGPTRYVLERVDRTPVEIVIKNDSIFVSREREQPDRKRGSRNGRRRYSPGHRTFQNLSLLKKNYRLDVVAGEPIAGHDTWRLEISHRLNARLAERIWFDRETGLILARQRWNWRNEPIQNYRYTSIEFRDWMEAKLFDTSGLHGRARRENTRTKTARIHDGKTAEVFKGLDLPGGFQLVAGAHTERKGWPLFHGSLTDGLRSLSVFARRVEDENKAKPSRHTWSGVEARKETKGNIHYTLVGDLDTEEMTAIFNTLPPELPLPGSPGRIPKLIALIAFALAVVTLSIVFVKRLLT
ncbi:sigma-E factor regulatory protein RseB domain-containing protein [candidate division KSB1 bacterium]